MKALNYDHRTAGYPGCIPSPSSDFFGIHIDLNELLVDSPAQTFYARVDGQSMPELGIDTGDLLVIDRSIRPGNGTIAVCYIGEEFTLKRLMVAESGVYFMPTNKNAKPIKVSEVNNLIVWGTVTYVIKKMNYHKQRVI